MLSAPPPPARTTKLSALPRVPRPLTSTDPSFLPCYSLFNAFKLHRQRYHVCHFNTCLSGSSVVRPRETEGNSQRIPETDHKTRRSQGGSREMRTLWGGNRPYTRPLGWTGKTGLEPTNIEQKRPKTGLGPGLDLQHSLPGPLFPWPTPHNPTSSSLRTRPRVEKPLPYFKANTKH